MQQSRAIPRGWQIGSVVSKAQKYVEAVLVVDDGSTDDAVEVVTVAGAVVVSHGANSGKGQRGQDIA